MLTSTEIPKSISTTANSTAQITPPKLLPKPLYLQSKQHTRENTLSTSICSGDLCQQKPAVKLARVLYDFAGEATYDELVLRTNDVVAV